jgi:hypothetical protein
VLWTEMGRKEATDQFGITLTMEVVGWLKNSCSWVILIFHNCCEPIQLYSKRRSNKKEMGKKIKE